MKLENDKIMISLDTSPFEDIENFAKQRNSEVPVGLMAYLKNRLAEPNSKIKLEMGRVIGIGGEGIVLRKQTKIKGKYVECAFKLGYHGRKKRIFFYITPAVLHRS